MLPPLTALRGAILLAPLGFTVLEIQAAADRIEQRVTTIVANDTGTPIDDLRASDFVIRVGEANREVLRVERRTGPIAVVFVFDIELADVPQAQASMDAVVGMLRQHDERSRVALTRLAAPSVGFASVRDAAAIREMRDQLLGMGYDVLPGVVEAARALEQAAEPRKMAVAITRTRRRAPDLTATQVSMEIRSSGAMLFGIEIGPLTAGSGTTAAEKVMNVVTTLSGGWRERIAGTLPLETTVRRMMTQVFSQYVVTFAGPLSTDDLVRVGVRRDRARVFARAWPSR